MRRSISNLAWEPKFSDDIFPILREFSIEGLEVALSKIWPDIQAIQKNDVIKFKGRLESWQLSVSGIQSIFYGKPFLQILDKKSWHDIFEHLKHLFEIAHVLGAEKIVFGSPKNRLRGNLEIHQANEIAAEFFFHTSKLLEQNNLILCIEPNAIQYGGDYLVRYQEVLDLLKLITSSRIKAQIDTGNLIMAGEEIEEAIKLQLPAHFHVSAENLLPPSDSVTHGRYHELLKNYGYKEWVVLEVLSSNINSIEGFQQVAHWFSSTYPRS